MTRAYLILTTAALFSLSPAAAAESTAIQNNDVTAMKGTAVTVAIAAQKSPNSSQCKKDSGLFNRLGGFFGIAAVVNTFSDAILVNPVLNQNPALAEWNQTQAATRLPGLKFLRTMWIAAMVGGPIKYTGQPLEQAHDRFNMTPAEFAEVGSEIVKALQAAGVAQADIDQAVCIYQTSMDEVVSSSGALEARTPPRN